MGARRSRTSARKMTVVKVRRAIAELILNLEGFLLSIKRERARVTGAKANMFGMVLPIQKGRWNWSMDSKVKLKDVLESKRRLTAMRIRRRASRLKDMRTRRAACCITIFGRTAPAD